MLSRDYVSFDQADILFFHTTENNALVSFASMEARTIPGLGAALPSMVRDARKTFHTSRWELASVGAVPGLLCMSTDGNGHFMGAWVGLQTLLSEESAQPQGADRGMLIISADGGTHVATDNLPTPSTRWR
jgi:hypothetical protein